MAKYGFRVCAVCCILIFTAFALRISGAVIEVSSFDDLVKVGSSDWPDWPLSGDYELTRDIDASASRLMNRREGFKPIGSDKAPFTGTFYGNGFKVSGLYINRPDANHVGMFGFLGESATVKNLSVVADSIIGRYAVGALAGGSDGVIRGCYSAGFVQASIKEREGNVGGLVGVNGGRIAASFSGATVNGKAHVGGLVGFLTSEISESYAVGAVSGDNYVGGLVGYAFGGSINMCFAAGMVIGTGKKSVVGGLVGYDFGGSNAAWNNAGRSTTGSNAGKLIKEADIKECYWNINTSGIIVSAGGEGTTTAIMASDSIFKAWDFDSTWVMSDSSYYPLLKDIPTFTLTYKADYNGKLEVKGAQDKVDRCIMALGDGSVGFEVRAVPNANYYFVRWNDGNANPVRSDMVTADTMFAAEFALLPDVETKTLTYTAGSHGKIRISGPNSAIESGTYSVRVVAGEYGIEVEAVADTGYRFYIWADGWEKPKRIDKAHSNMNHAAFFVRDDGSNPNIHGYTTPGDSDGGGSLRIYGISGNVHAHSDVDAVGSDIVVVPDPGYSFFGWNDGVGSIVRKDSDPGAIVVMAGFRKIEDSGVIRVSSLDDLRKIGTSPQFPLSADYRLTRSISVPSDVDFEPIGSESNPFTGTFNGNGNTISGFKINRLSSSFCGLFGYVKNATIRDIRLRDVSISGKDNIGGLIGYCENTYVAKCGLLMGAVGGEANVGGLIGQVKGSVVDFCYSKASVSASRSAGGLIGAVLRGAVFQSYSSGKVTGSRDIGGFAGSCADCMAEREIRGCYYDIGTSGVNGDAGAIGKSTEFMKMLSTYADWSIGKNASGAVFVWTIGEDGLDYPSLASSGAAYSPMPKRKLDSAPSAAKPLVKIHGRTLSVYAPANSAVQVRLIDMRGRTAARHAATGQADFSLTGTPAGRYIVETKINGKRADLKRVFYSN